jgi:ribosome-associated protein
LPDGVLGRLKSVAGRRMTRDGVIVITARRFRSQERNRQDARDRLAALIRRAATPPKPRKPTRPSRAARARRLDQKRQRGGLKKGRGQVRDLE